MNLSKFKYLLIFCFTLTLLIKASGMSAYLSLSSKSTQYISLNSDSAEEKETKIETGWYDDYFLSNTSFALQKQPIKNQEIYYNVFNPTYIPEVLTPPPSGKASY